MPLPRSCANTWEAHRNGYRGKRRAGGVDPSLQRTRAYIHAVGITHRDVKRSKHAGLIIKLCRLWHGEIQRCRKDGHIHRKGDLHVPRVVQEDAALHMHKQIPDLIILLQNPAGIKISISLCS
ncbi:hypothetical protein ACJ72_04429 [Emergomyces africanus]|uniref:Uncharacterized protein n=1 Tax=Emergomyces africanus TaxID=1955775 RepID=A0A1B7NX91_9EURO|nr:hypothetical protein ACJ72_04429 [Emergomyces africanus]